MLGLRLGGCREVLEGRDYLHGKTHIHMQEHVSTQECALDLWDKFPGRQTARISRPCRDCCLWKARPTQETMLH